MNWAAVGIPLLWMAIGAITAELLRVVHTRQLLALLGTRLGQRSDAEPPARSEPVRRPKLLPSSAMPRPARRPTPGDGIDVMHLMEGGEVHPDFHDEVATLLSGVLEREPGRLDLRIKLAEVYQACGRREDFLVQAERLRRDLPADDPRWTPVCLIGRHWCEGHPLFAAPPPMSVEQMPPSARYFESLDGELFRRWASEVERAHDDLRRSPELHSMFGHAVRTLLERPTPLVELDGSTRDVSGARLLLKREDLAGAGQRDWINVIAQALLAKRMGCSRLVTGALTMEHALATAVCGVRMEIDCAVYLNLETHGLSDESLKLLRCLGTEVHTVARSNREDSADCRRSALCDVINAGGSAFFVSNLGGGPPPYPRIIRDFQSVVGSELRAQLRARRVFTPDHLIASEDAGQSALGFVLPYLADRNCRISCVAAAGSHEGLQDASSRAIRAMREHSWLRNSGRVDYGHVDAADRRRADRLIAEQLDAALCPADRDAVALGLRHARSLWEAQTVVVLIAGPPDQPATRSLSDIALPPGTADTVLRMASGETPTAH